MTSFEPARFVTLTHPEWLRDATLYQINTRQFTPEGTFAAAMRELPRVRALGIDIVWLMPIHPIGERRRKGALGSPYAVRDYRDVNPEFGTREDFARFVDAAHACGLRVILDWVANHTAWDNPLLDEHPEWYARDAAGAFRSTPWWDWDDIADLDYATPELRRWMTESMSYWVREFDVDGFRCDVADFVPTDFWVTARGALEAIKPVFLLAEAETRDLHAAAFDATYAWSWYDAVVEACAGRGLAPLRAWYGAHAKVFPRDGLRMTFVSNHDKNAWVGTEFEQFGEGVRAAIALSVVGGDLPLVYNGQEAGNERRLAFFDRDPIVWRAHPHGALYAQLFALKKAHPALGNGPWGGVPDPVAIDEPERVLGLARRRGSDVVVAAFNFSGESCAIRVLDAACHGAFRDGVSGEPATLDAASRVPLEPWGYRLWVR